MKYKNEVNLTMTYETFEKHLKDAFNSGVMSTKEGQTDPIGQTKKTSKKKATKKAVNTKEK